MLNSFNKISRGNLTNLKELLSLQQSKFFFSNKISFTKNIPLCNFSSKNTHSTTVTQVKPILPTTQHKNIFSSQKTQNTLLKIKLSHFSSDAAKTKSAEEDQALDDLNTIKMQDPTKFRNIAIIAHVDHGKTTLVDCMLKQAGVSISNERAMDSNELEQERGITILSKCTGISYNGFKINIVDTPGHQDFGGEVERIMNMVDGVILVVCASEGPMPQTRFVLKKALQRGLKPIVVVNKVDRDTARVSEVENEVFDLFCNLNATEDQLDYDLLMGSARNGWVVRNMNDPKENIKALLDAIVERIPHPVVDLKKDFSMLVSQTESNQFFGKMLIGRIAAGKVSVGDKITTVDQQGKVLENNKVFKIIRRYGVHQIELDSAVAGDIVSIAGFEKTTVTNTLNTLGNTNVIPSIPIDPPMISMTIRPNDSPLFGKDGDKFTFLQLKERLVRESENDVSLRVETDARQKDAIFAFGRGDLHLGILVEKMRREGYEMSLTPPQVIYKEIDGEKHEPIEEVSIEIGNEHVNILIDSIQNRKGLLLSSEDVGSDKSKVTFEAPSRGLFGFRPYMIALSKGHCIITSKLKGYEKFKGSLKRSTKGAIISVGVGKATHHALKDNETHGLLYITPGDETYAGHVIGELNKEGEVEVNPCKEKASSNVRSTSKEEYIKLSPPKLLVLEDTMVSLRSDELLEVTPKNLRIRKKILDSSARRKFKRENKNEEDH